MAEPAPNTVETASLLRDVVIAMEPLMVDAKRAAALFGLNSRTWYRFNAAGKCPAPMHLGRALRWDVEELTEWKRAKCPPREKWEQQRKR